LFQNLFIICLDVLIMYDVNYKNLKESWIINSNYE